jgi:hypothetical protein
MGVHREGATSPSFLLVGQANLQGRRVTTSLESCPGTPAEPWETLD